MDNFLTSKFLGNPKVGPFLASSTILDHLDFSTTNGLHHFSSPVVFWLHAKKSEKSDVPTPGNVVADGGTTCIIPYDTLANVLDQK